MLGGVRPLNAVLHCFNLLELLSVLYDLYIDVCVIMVNLMRCEL
jgi:hypothetical protein